MRVIVIDDEAGKRAQIVSFLSESPLALEIDEAVSFQGGMAALRRGGYDCVVLDMRLTTYDVSPADDGGRPRNVGGEEVLRKMRRRGDSTPVVVLTQYSIFKQGANMIPIETLSTRLSEAYPPFLGILQFRHRDEDWKVQLFQVLEALQ